MDQTAHIARQESLPMARWWSHPLRFIKNSKNPSDLVLALPTMDHLATLEHLLSMLQAEFLSLLAAQVQGTHVPPQTLSTHWKVCQILQFTELPWQLLMIQACSCHLVTPYTNDRHHLFPPCHQLEFPVTLCTDPLQHPGPLPCLLGVVWMLHIAPLLKLGVSALSLRTAVTSMSRLNSFLTADYHRLTSARWSTYYINGQCLSICDI